MIGWQRDAGDFSFFSDPRDIRLLEELHLHLDSVFPLIADTLHATVTNPIRVDIYPSHAAFLDHLRSLGWTPEDWYIGTALSAEWILVESSNSPDNRLTSGDVASLVTHEAIHSIIFTFGTPVPQWLHEGLAGLDAALLADCFPDCTANWDYQRSVVASVGKPGLWTMFSDPTVGYAFSTTTAMFMVKKYGWSSLQTFLTSPTDYSVFGSADSGAFQIQWHAYLDELWGYVEPPPSTVLSIADARGISGGAVTVEGIVTWQLPWDARTLSLIHI